jgi:hypothetical protein
MSAATELNRNNHSQPLGDYNRQEWRRSGLKADPIMYASCDGIDLSFAAFPELKCAPIV